MQYLLLDTTFSVIAAEKVSKTSTADIGAPQQGDELLPVLFIIYLDAALKKYWYVYGKPDTPQYQYCMCADNTNFISTLYADHFFAKLYLPDILKKWNLKMNI